MAIVVFKSKLKELTGTMSKIGAVALEEIGGRAESHAMVYLTKSGAVDTGALRNSVTHKVEGYDTVIIGTPLFYGPFIELGTGIYAEGGGGRKTPWHWKDEKGNWHTTSGMPPRPFLRPAILNHLDEYKKVILREFRQHA